MWGAQQNTQADAAGAMVEVQAPVDAEASAKAAGREPSPAPLPGAEAPGAGAPVEGAAVQATAPIPAEQAQAFWRGKLAAANFGGAVSLFMRSPAHRHYTMADLEWCLLPALALNQFMAGEARLPDGQAVPSALVLWARVSEEIDARLSAAPRYPIRLHPNGWHSGDVYWIVDTIGEQKAVQQCVEALTKTVFREQEFRMLQRGM
jgi:hemolysin-activating ACP:hemolysin acyltransferase